MSLIQIRDLKFRYDHSYDMVFDGVSFSFDTNYKTALIGRNARGKTTFLKLLMNAYEYQGEIIKNVECVYFPYQVANPQDWTINICEEMLSDFEQWKLEKELNALEVSLDVLYRPFETLSQGEQTKVLLAVLFLKEYTYLLIDEPTNHLDQHSRERVAAYLKKQKGFLLVSHDRYFIDMCCDHVIAFNPESIDVVNGNFSSWYENKQNEDQNEMRRNEKLKKDIARLESSSRQASHWSDEVEKTKIGQKVSGLRPDRGFIGHKAAKMMKRSKNIEKRQNKAIQEKKGLLKNIEEYDDLKMHPLTYDGRTLVEMNHGILSYPDKVLCRDFSMVIHPHDRLLLKGHNGCGKSSVIRYLLNGDVLFDGITFQGSRLKISYVPQDCRFIHGELDDLIDKSDVDETLVKTILRKLGFSRIHLEKRLEDLSDGQKKKVMLAISLATSAHLYIWDEPLNYIDIFSRMQIEKVILEYKPTLLFVEHDTYFQDTIATHMIDFDRLDIESSIK